MNFKVYQFNNYYNRILKHYETIAEYGEPIAEISSVSFNPNDGISTAQIINYDGTPIDYALLVNDEDDILSRWYIIENQRLREGQYSLSLFRDLLADYKKEVLSSKTYIEKGWLSSSDAGIYNLEASSFNEIKAAEALIRDGSYCPWIVGYYDKTATAEDLTGPVDIKNDNLVYTQLTGNLDSWQYYSYITNDFRGRWIPNTSKIRTEFGTTFAQLTGPNAGYFGYINVNKSGIINYTKDTSVYPAQLNLKNEVGPSAYSNGIGMDRVLQSFSSSFNERTSNSEVFTLAENYLPNPSQAEVDTYLALNQTLLRDLDGKFYKIRLVYKPNTTVTTPVSAGNLFNVMADVVNNSTTTYNNIGKIFGTAPGIDTFSIQASYPVYRLVADPAPQFEATFDLYNSDGGGAVQTQGTPYNVFAIPYGEVEITNVGDIYGSGYLIGSKEVALATAAAIQKKLQHRLYDIQLLPYFPYQDLIRGDDVIVIPNSETISYVKNSEENFTVIFNCPYAQFEAKNLRLVGDSIDLRVGTTAIERKVNRQCNKYRLASPNYSNYFDFSVELNNGVRRFTADCEYKPYSPYIHINPEFDGLYGRDYNDPRGLILGGDFSLTQVIDQWQTYQLNNKNYEAIFARQIQNLEVQQKYGQTQDVINAITGTFSGATSGAMMGSAAGPWGMAIGGIVGGGASLAAGMGDISINQALRDEAKDYTQDLYNLQLQNIQALPVTLSKVSSINPNNKLYPVLEFYTCTDLEKEAFRNKLLYNGMTIDRIGTLFDMLNNIDFDESEERYYWKGRLIRIDLPEDFHLTNAISNELNKGVFI